MIPANVISIPRPEATSGQLPARDEPAPRPAAETVPQPQAIEPVPTASVTTVPPSVVLPLDESAAGRSDSPALEVARAAQTWSSRSGATSGDINSQVQWVLRDSYLESTRDLYFFANKVRFFNAVKDAIRDELARANQALSTTAGREDDARLDPPFTTRPIDETYYGEAFVPPPPVEETAETRPELPPVFRAVLDGMKALLPLIIREAFNKNCPNGDLGLADEVVDMVLDLIAGIESGNPEEIVRAIAEGIYDSLEIVLPLAVAHYFPGAAAIPGLPQLITQTIMGLLPDPSEQRDDDPHTLETRAELEAYIEKLEANLNSVGDDAQLANVDLQNMLQKQQQTIQMMSNIAKMLHDTTMAVVRKLGS